MLDIRAAAIWWLSFLYFGASVFYVRLVYHPTVRPKSKTAQEMRVRAGKQLLSYLTFATLSIATLAATGWMPRLALAALLPAVVKGIWAGAEPGYCPTLKQVGIAEIGHSSLFALLAVVTITAAKVG